MATIDITTTATIRPGILYRTLESFQKNLLKGNHEYRLIINVDPVGEHGKTQDDVIDVARSFYPNVVSNKPSIDNFPQAVIWCWHQIQSDYIFHLEDDWTMLKEIDIDRILDVIDHYPKISSFVFSKIKLPERPSDNIDEFLMKRPRICLNPGFIRRSFIEKVRGKMVPTKDPERQLRENDKNLGRYIRKTRHAFYVECGLSPLVVDIGKQWINEYGRYQKAISGIRWEVW